MADKLTPQQFQAVHDRGGNLLVSAAAGSGKTKVLVDRLMSYLLDPQDPANLDDFLIITYTKAAASELRGKIAARLTLQIAQEPENRHLQKQMQRLFLTKISTVHGFCGDLLREYAYKLGLSPDFRVADETESQELREVVLTELLDQAYRQEQMDGDFRAFVDTQGLGRDDRLVPELILKVYDSARCHLNPESWLESCISSSGVEAAEDVASTVWGRYLLEDLKAYLDAQILVFRQCVQKADCCPGMEKAAQNLRQTLFQLEQLRDSSGWDDVVRNARIDYGRLTFPTKNNPDPELTERIKAVRNACKKGVEKKLQAFSDPSRQLLLDLETCAAGTRGLVSLVRCFDEAYSRAKKSRRMLDFGDLEHQTLDLLLGKGRSAPTAAAREIGARFREIMVDEYQDSNGVQDAIFEALTRQRHNCFLVGDVKQSIYQFRLADPGIFLEKYRTYVPVEQAQPRMGRKVLLSHNFRSGPEVVEAVNDVFFHCMTRTVGGLDYTQAEALREGIPRDPLPDAAVELHCVEVREDTYAEEAAYVARQIHRMLETGTPVRTEDGLRPVKPEDIVILLRSPGSVGGQFQQALEAKGLRCSSGGSGDLLETEEVGMLRCFLQVIVNPRQDIPLISVLASPVFGFTADDLAQVRCHQKRGCFYDALTQCSLPKAKRFLDILVALRRDAGRYSLTRLLEACFARTRLDSIYGARENGAAKCANLQAFFQLAAEYERNDLRDLPRFLQYLDSLQGRGLQAAGGPTGGITIMSIHKSKGLEFPVVFLCGLSRRFNRESLQAQILCDRDLGLGLSVADPENRIRYPSVARRAIMVKAARESLSEEMRVLYVAMTRARDRLVMTYAAKNLPGVLQETALRMEFDRGALVCRDASCPGAWILLAALQRREAGTFHTLAGCSPETAMGSYPWKIETGDAPEPGEAACGITAEVQEMPPDARQAVQEGLSFRYPHAAATVSPSKRTATDRKGRLKDAEAAEYTAEASIYQRNWRIPGFLGSRTDARTYGNAIHRAMEYLDFSRCGDMPTLRQEVTRLEQMGFLSHEEAALVDVSRIVPFFQTEIGKKLVDGCSCLREFKFSLLDDGRNYSPELEGEQVLLQGVVDCALVEPDGITVVDFKTDRVTEATAAAAAQRYCGQVETYCEALSRIFELPVKARYLYFFAINSLWKL